MIEAIENELRKIDRITKYETDEHGYGVALVEPGFCFHQAILVGSYQYLLHYNVTAASDDVIVAYMSKKKFE